MSSMGQGELFAISAELMERLIGCKANRELMELIEELEESCSSDHRQFCSKEWVEIHQCLTGSRQNPKAGAPFLHRCFLGTRYLTDPDGGYIVALLCPDEVPPLALALMELTDDWFRKRFVAIFGRPKDAEVLNWLPEHFGEITR